MLSDDPENLPPDEEDGDDVNADDQATVTCPYCGEAGEILLDPGGGGTQEYIEDCGVCCQPWRVHVRWRRNGRAEVRLDTADG